MPPKKKAAPLKPGKIKSGKTKPGKTANPPKSAKKEKPKPAAKGKKPAAPKKPAAKAKKPAPRPKKALVAKDISKEKKPAPKKPVKAAKVVREVVRAKAPSVTSESEEERKAMLRRELLGMRDRIMKEARTEISKYIKGENRQLVETALDDGDWSVVDLSEDINLRKLSTHRENLRKIEEALRKLDEGTYGICEDCGEEISIERLKVMPFAIYCRDDQEKREMMEALEREMG